MAHHCVARVDGFRDLHKAAYKFRTGFSRNRLLHPAILVHEVFVIFHQSLSTDVMWNFLAKFLIIPKCGVDFGYSVACIRDQFVYLSNGIVTKY